MDNITTHRLKVLKLTMIILTVTSILGMALSVVLGRWKLDIIIFKDIDNTEYEQTTSIAKITADTKNKHLLHVEAYKAGQMDIVNQKDDTQPMCFITVLPSGIVYNISTFDFSGSSQITLILSMYLVLITVICFISLIIRMKYALFSYNTLYKAGFFVFLLSNSVFSLALVWKMLFDTQYYSAMYLTSFLKNMGPNMMVFILPLALILSVMLIISNISLIRHEGLNFVNVLGIVFGGVIIFGYLIELFLGTIFISGSEQQVKTYDAIKSIYSTGFTYLLSMIIGSSVCALYAARKKPDHDRTHIIILGCSIAKDGTPLPLLRGRIDRAIEFSKQQNEKTGRQVKFVPSGGQGSDEVISEALCMKNYLLSQGIAEDLIITEDRSTSTQENMRFSGELISRDCDEAKLIFSTSSYHVLRSGIIAAEEGLKTQGVGCRTKWYFWPNAFVREFIGLMYSKKKQHIIWLVFFIVSIIAIHFTLPM